MKTLKKKVDCKYCNGVGEIKVKNDKHNPFIPIDESGKYYVMECARCNGTGQVIIKEKTIKL